MKDFRLIALSLFIFVIIFCCTEENEYRDWSVHYSSDSRELSLKKNSEIICRDLYASYILDGRTITTKDYSDVRIEENDIRDGFGKGKVFSMICREAGLPALTRFFYLYEDKDYILTEFLIDGDAEIVSTNYMAPVNIDNFTLLGESTDNRALFVPFDNDKWIRYKSHRLTFSELKSYEVTSVFNNDSRRGIVVGSVEHDSWKTAVSMTSNGSDALNSLICYGGVADTLTRDTKPHGALKGNTVKSPRVLLGVFDDWRNGLDEYGLANAIIAPPKAWDRPVPFGWNSWGVLQFGLTFEKAMEVSDFFKDNLQNNGFLSADNTVCIGLDSGWNRFTEDELREFVRKCRENGQIAGIYWTPFNDWGAKPDEVISDKDSPKYKDYYVYANGLPQYLDGAYAIDPTHPVAEERMKKMSELFHRCGFEYVKMDFMTHAAMEADKWYRADIQTGIQAYNYGMKLLDMYFGKMYVNLSISPIFPAHYAQSRRITCDAWNKIEDTEYTVNAVSYGWWLDKVYQFNDADHIVLKDATEGENRARVTSSVMSGLYIAGDDFSRDGNPEGKQKAKKFLTNSAINRIATGVAFRPVEGDGERSENQFVRVDENHTYYICFNYGNTDLDVMIPVDRIGLDQAEAYLAEDLWKSETVDIKLPLTIPAKDVAVICLTPAN
jgi:alpha-galactosidase